MDCGYASADVIKYLNESNLDYSLAYHPRFQDLEAPGCIIFTVKNRERGIQACLTSSIMYSLGHNTNE